ncbi:50S ribosomal protein l7/l12 [Phtheirospermum japonicum]|uniref:Large ribosomal subunit protein bL12c n=1 Tax=Phtheirospermum japonicum TaxID=374723 RepID=A0A830D6P3_9LAMI|nr:50S ribosomal protein l7/l12 [Phtheirospermum japonicum]
MKAATLYRIARANPTLFGKPNLAQYRCFQPDFVPRDPKAKPTRYKYPAAYDPYGPRPPPSDKIVQLVEKIAALPPEERMQIGPTLRAKVMHPKLQSISVEGVEMGATDAGSSKAVEKKAEKTTFDVKLEKFDAGAKLKVIKEIRSFTDLGLKEAKDLVEKAPVILKQQVTKDEANSIIEKIKAVGGVALME